ncbi:MAG TPA: tagatose-6-phosphate ketose isomerase [Silvibacterium sp.]|nr:tagatose-6-phosphate ketose isomerase [Silvibacterium sp.]
MDPLAAMLDLSAAEKLDRGLTHTPDEIAQQPQTWLGTFRLLKSRQSELQKFLTAAGVDGPLEQRPTVFLIGAGTSDYIGHSLHHLLRSKWQCEVIPVASTNLLTGFSEYLLQNKRYLWISFSRSGDSPEGVAVLERALAECPDIAQIVVSCNASGRMSRAIQGRENCLTIVLDDATNDRSLAMTSSFTNMVVAGQVLAHAWEMAEYETILHPLVRAGKALLPKAAELAAELFQDGYTSACFVGSGVLAGAAMECALKVLELSAGNLQTFTQSTLALRHGPMAALHRDTLFVSLVSSQPQRRQYEVDLLREIGFKELVRTRVALATSDPESLWADAEYVLAPDGFFEIPDLYRPVLDVIFGQLLGLFGALRFGLKPDVPSPNGVINRVVQNVDIY